jgi:hypothetical protein
MTSQSLRIYLYKITFEEVPYYYYGVHKEKKFDEYYVGTPVTHKWCWNFYTPKKQILQLFDYTDEGWIEAQEIEKQLIKPFYNIDKWCLNENVGGYFSLEASRKNGRIVGLKHKENSTGFCGRTPEQMSEDGRKSGLKHKENGTGIFAQTPEQRSENSRKIGFKTKEDGTGIFSMTAEEQSERSRKGGKIGGKITNSQKWECLETGYVSNAGALSHYQNHRGIDTSKRKRIA